MIKLYKATLISHLYIYKIINLLNINNNIISIISIKLNIFSLVMHCKLYFLFLYIIFIFTFQIQNFILFHKINYLVEEKWNCLINQFLTFFNSFILIIIIKI